LKAKVSDDNDDFERADPAAHAALEYARSLPPASLAPRLLGKLGSCGALRTDYEHLGLPLVVADRGSLRSKELGSGTS
jgi:hypothetical protein